MGVGIPNWRAGTFILLTIGTGAAALGLALRESHLSDIRLLLFAIMTAVSALFPIYLPTDKKKNLGVVVTIASIFIFTAILVFGPAEAALLALVEAVVSVWRNHRTMKSVHKVLFNLFHLPLVTYLTGQFLYAALGVAAPLNPQAPPNISLLFLAASLSSVLYFMLNTGAVALAISLSTADSIQRVWRNDFVPSLLSNFAETAAAVVVFLNLSNTIPLALGIALPTAFVIYYAYKMNLTRIGEARRHVEEVNDLYHSTIEALAMAVDAKDQVTHGHIYRVQAMVLGLAERCGITDDQELSGLRAAALLHDIGKLATPDYILNKPGTLTNAEMETMKTHAALGADILASVPFPYPVIPFVRYHHERWDGSGYPEGLKGEEIPLGARILAIIDCYDALRSDRPYRAKLSREAALDYIRSEAGRSYDPAVVQHLVENIDALETLAFESPRPAELAAKPTLPQPGKPAEKTSGTVFNDIASAHREVQAIHEISKAVGRLLNVSETLALLTGKLQQLIPFDACAIFLPDSDHEWLEPQHASGLAAAHLSQLELRFGEGVTGWVAANLRPLLNVSPGPDFKGHPQLQEQFQSCLAVPLLMDRDTVGVISLYGTTASAFQPNHLRLLDNVAQHAATAINNAVLFEETREDAYTDLLTGLPNLRYFQIFAEQELMRAERSGYPVTIIMMDLDNFKIVNDQLGHKTGDRVLIEISHILRNQLRKSDTCVRYGGDEFIGVLPGVDQTSSKKVISKIQAAVDGHTVQLSNDRSICVGISIGAASYPTGGRRLDQLLIQADREMYRDKLSRSRRSTGVLVPFERKSESA